MLLQAAKCIGAGCATIGLAEAGIGIGKRARAFSTKKKKLTIHTLYTMITELNVKMKTNLFVFVIALITAYWGYYLVTVYCVLHFVIVLLSTCSKNFEQRLENFKKDQETIREHYLESFRGFYYSFFAIRIITFFFYWFFFSQNVAHMQDLSNVFYGVSYLFILVNAIDLAIILYIIIYKK